MQKNFQDDSKNFSDLINKKNPNNLKIAIVHDFLVRFWWAERLVKNFSENFPDAKIFTLFYDEKNMWKFFPKNKIITSSIQKLYNLSFWKYTHLFWMMPKAIEEFDFSDYDVVISSSSAFSKWLIAWPETYHISYVHAPMRYSWDYFFKYPKEKKMWFLKKYFFKKMTSKIREWDFVSAQRPDKIICPSQDVQKRIKKFWNRDSEIVYPFVEIEKFLPIENSTKGYFLVVSQLVPYKKVDQIISAFSEYSKKFPDEKLKIVWTWPEEDFLKKMAKKSFWKNFGKNIEFVWARHWDELIWLYQNAKIFIFASIDDFWMTPIEAMSCWIPVLAISEWWALETVIWDWEFQTWFFYDKQDSKNISDKLIWIKDNKFLEWENYFKLQKNCINQAKKFSKEIFEEKIFWEVEKFLKK